MTTTAEYPHYVRGFTAAGADELKKAQSKFADWQRRPNATFDASLTDAAALATDFLAKLAHPSHLFDALSKAAQDRVAAAVGLGPRKAWKPAAPVPKDLPVYKRPSWEKDVYEVLFKRHVAPPPTLRAPAAKPKASPWPELESLTAWKKSPRPGVVTRLVKRLGAGWSALAPTGTAKLPRVRHEQWDLAFVAVPGGKFKMGLTADELTALRAHFKKAGPEVALHLRELATLAGPARTVTVAPFLCAETPLLEAHAKRLGVEGDAANPHAVLRVGSEGSAALVQKLGARLLSQAEWVWLAREGGKRAWLSGEEEPAEWTKRVLAAPLAQEAGALGVVGLGWGEWVDDGWHSSYLKAPKTSEAWEPKTRPEVVRGGGLLSWPWQMGGEALLLHAAVRERSNAAHAVRLVVPLP